MNDKWNPVVSWAEHYLGIKLDVQYGINVPQHPPETYSRVKEFIATQYPPFALTGLEYAIELTKSTILGIALMERRVTVEEATYLSNLELEYQISRFGKVEWAHDVDFLDLRVRLCAAAAVGRFTRQYPAPAASVI
jgi:ATP synthase F1 complex assembly factor 2